MKLNYDNAKCWGCVYLGECDGKTVCYNLAHLPVAQITENLPCHAIPECKSHIETIQALMKASYGVTLPRGNDGSNHD